MCVFAALVNLTASYLSSRIIDHSDYFRLTNFWYWRTCVMVAFVNTNVLVVHSVWLAHVHLCSHYHAIRSCLVFYLPQNHSIHVHICFHSTNCVFNYQTLCHWHRSLSFLYQTSLYPIPTVTLNWNIPRRKSLVCTFTPWLFPSHLSNIVFYDHSSVSHCLSKRTQNTGATINAGHSVKMWFGKL